MFVLGFVLGFLGLVSCAWLMGGASLIAFVVGWVSRLIGMQAPVRLSPHQKFDLDQRPTPLSLTVAIPVHNEERTIEATVRSIEKALLHAQAQVPSLKASIRVLLDHSTDGSEECLRTLTSDLSVPMIVSEHSGNAGKWWVLQDLCARASSDWVAFVDAGSVWDRELVLQWLRDVHERNEILAGWAPSYEPCGAGFFERFFWRLEATLKALENQACGPISVHGATVFYDRQALDRAFAYLGKDEHWLNDDVVLPLVFRKLRLGPILYARRAGFASWVSDLGVLSDLRVESRRRERISRGNVQWMQEPAVLPNRSDGLGWILASRRMLRAAWAYPILSMIVGVMLVLWSLSPLVLVFLLPSAVILVLRVPFLRRLSTAIMAALRVPGRIFRAQKKETVQWV